ncbi:MAG: hypothetical protein DA408_10670 [Bacteroidetes bacterium]|nr:MAG: hypothetical protein C7N36_07925 [Bacteroidota bacterium]PTM12417.1 MAG: hypothetical protein DA408_10670 [Bacteroidota bacterium]
MMTLAFSHLVNPVQVGPSSDLYVAQPITFQSMLRAQQEAARHAVEVNLLTTQYPEDHAVIPAYFQLTPDLERSVLDIRSFQRPRKLPLIGDIMSRLYHHSSSPYLIYTNVDIGLQPHFYCRVAELLTQTGCDALLINRRRLPASYVSPEELPRIYLDPGKPHPGFDCFVFHRDLYPRMRFAEICVGVPFIGVNLAHNLFAFANKCLLIDDEHLTFHLGEVVMPQHDPEYYWHNRNCFRRIRDEHLWPHFDIRKFPYAELPVGQRYWKWAWNPSLFTFMNFRLTLRSYYLSLQRQVGSGDAR